MMSLPNSSGHISIKSPIRVDLAGGTLDCWPLCQLIPQSLTINYALGLFTKVELKKHETPTVVLHSKDLKWTKEFASRREFLAAQDPQLLLYQVVVEQFPEVSGFELWTQSESPVGAGLGGSSSLLISLLKAFKSIANRSITDVKMVELACNLETRLLGKPAGTQDYFPAIYGGLNLIEYVAEGPKWSILDVNTDFLKTNAILVYTGRAHHSGLNNWEVIQRALNGDIKVLTALKEVARISREMLVALKENNTNKIFLLFREELVERLKLAPAFSSPEIEKLAGLCEANQSALKICGSGGGGCVLVLTRTTEDKTTLSKKINEMGFTCFDSSPWKDPGCPI